MVSVHPGLMLVLVSLKDQSFDPCCSWYILMIYLMVFKSKCKLFANHTSLFPVFHDINTSASDHNEELKKIANWDFKWKMNFNPDPNTTWKVSKYRVFSGRHFPVFRLNTEIYGVNLHIQFEYRKIRTRKNCVFRHFSCSLINKLKKLYLVRRKLPHCIQLQALITDQLN